MQDAEGMTGGIDFVAEGDGASIEKAVVGVDDPDFPPKDAMVVYPGERFRRVREIARELRAEEERMHPSLKDARIIELYELVCLL